MKVLLEGIGEVQDAAQVTSSTRRTDGIVLLVPPRDPRTVYEHSSVGTLSAKRRTAPGSATSIGYTDTALILCHRLRLAR